MDGYYGVLSHMCSSVGASQTCDNYSIFAGQAVAEFLGDDGMMPAELDDAFAWFEKASGVQASVHHHQGRVGEAVVARCVET